MLKKFKFFCQKILPLSYDASLSYYEAICKLVSHVNKIGDATNELQEVDSRIISKIGEMEKGLVDADGVTEDYVPASNGDGTWSWKEQQGGGSSGVTDVLVNGDSVVSDGVANISISTDVYSTEERVVSTWVDGRPVYEKTYIGKAEYRYTNIIIENVNSIYDNIISASGFVKNDNGTGVSMGGLSNSSDWTLGCHITGQGQLAVYCGGATQTGNYIVTIRYTKISDLS